MAKQLVTFEVDGDTLFDMVAKVGDGGGGIGSRIVGTLLAPNDSSFSTALGMAVYGVVLKSVEPAAAETEAPDPSPLHPHAEGNGHG